jgi:hypothetical protein
MKKVLLLGIIITSVLSCSLDNSTEEEFFFEILPIESVTLPNEMRYQESYTINYTYFKPSTCHIFNDLYYLSEGNFRTIAVINTVLNEVNNVVCQPLTDELEERSFTFFCSNNSGTYVFKFWKGKDENGEDVYTFVEVPIVN